MSRPQIRIAIALLLAAGLLPASLSASGGGGGGASIQQGAPGMAPQSPQARAAQLYKYALGYRDKAWKLEEKAMANPSQRAKLEAKAKAQFERMERSLRQAVELNPAFYQAHGSLGYALRRLGDYQTALTSYDRALELNPNYPEAMEYRAEAYLGLDRIDDAQTAYARLSVISPEHATELLQAIGTWVDDRRTGGGKVEPQRLDEVAKWVEAREKIAATTTRASATGSW